MSANLDPDNWVDTGEAFPDDYSPAAGITHAEFTILPGDEVNRLSLVFDADGISFLGAFSGAYWALSIHAPYHYSGQDIPVHHEHAEHILAEMAGTDVFEEYDWHAQDWAYFE
jgi:hypothetical protein